MRPLTRRPSPLGVRRVLVLKPDHLGDLLLTTPALYTLRQHLPAGRIVALVGPWSRQLWQGHPALDAVVPLPFPGFARLPAGQRGWLLLLFKYGLLLRRERYDAALLLRDDHWWGAILIAIAGIPQRLGHAHPLCAPLLSAALPYDPRHHVTRQALAVVAALTTNNHTPSALPPGFPPTLFQPVEADQTWAAAWWAANLRPNERLVVIHPGTGGPTKHWTATGWASVGDALAAEPATRLLLTGGPGEAALVAEIAALLTRPALTLVGQTSVGQLAALLGRAALVLGVDSGPLHLAVSQGAPTLHLFGPSDQLRFGPWGAPHRHVVLRANLFCSPCGEFAACPRGTTGPECMIAISAATVLATARRLLG